MPKLFPRYRKPGVNELLGITQQKRKLSRRLHLSTLRDPTTPLKNAERRLKYQAGYYSEPMKAARKFGLLKRGSCSLVLAMIFIFVLLSVVLSFQITNYFVMALWPIS